MADVLQLEGARRSRPTVASPSASASVTRTPMLPQAVLPQAVLEQLHNLANFGDVPVSAYLYRPDVAARQAKRLRAALPEWADLFYAVKANSFPPVLAALAEEVEGFEVASHREAEWATSAAAAAGKPARLITSGPGKSDANLARLIQLGAELINVESVHRTAPGGPACRGSGQAAPGRSPCEPIGRSGRRVS